MEGTGQGEGISYSVDEGHTGPAEEANDEWDEERLTDALDSLNDMYIQVPQHS